MKDLVSRVAGVVAAWIGGFKVEECMELEFGFEWHPWCLEP